MPRVTIPVGNMEILEAVGQAVSEHGGPWVVGGDFNMSPDELVMVVELQRVEPMSAGPTFVNGSSACNGPECSK